MDDENEGWNWEAAGVCAVSESAIIPANEGSIMKSGPYRGTVVIKVDNVEVDVETATVMLADGQFSQATYPVIVTNGMLYQPAKTEFNLLLCCLGRLHTPFVGETDDALLSQRWRETGRRFRSLFTVQTSEPSTLLECAQALPGRKSEVFLAAARDLDEGRTRGFEELKKEVNVKTNETLYLKDINDDGMKSVMPRSIIVANNTYHVLHAPFARGVAKTMHAVLDGSVVTLDGRPFRLWFGSGLNGAQLSAIAESIENGDNVIAVAGDDCVFHDDALADPHHVRYAAGQLGGDADLSKCDQSQQKACLDETGLTLQQFGMPRRVAEQFVEQCGKPYVARYKRLRIEGDPGYELGTGFDETTIGNTAAVMSFWTAVVCDKTRSYEDLAFEHGFKAKVKPWSSVRDATFLKGWFCPQVGGGFAYLPLPSLAIKIGKVQTPVERLGGQAQTAFAIAQGCPVPPEMPILGAFVTALRRNGDARTTKVISASEDSWYKPKVSADVRIDVAEALAFIERRYGLTPSDVARVTRRLEAVNSLPAFVSDPVFRILAEVDYG